MACLGFWKGEARVECRKAPRGCVREGEPRPAEGGEMHCFKVMVPATESLAPDVHALCL